VSRTRKPRALVAAPAPIEAAAPFRFVAFGDLHVSAKTLDRAIDLLTRVGEVADEHGAEIVCLGDFWDLRNVLHVRHVDAVLSVIESWKAPAWFIPGNHDQVTIDGSVHGVRIFGPLPRVKVATDLMLDEARKLAFVPWREAEGEQEAIFQRVPDGYTVFAHAELQGATANNGKPAAGKLALHSAERFRALYMGHYHARQKLGTRSWYIGSPFEMDFGERGEPHGLALLTSDTIDPAFLDLDHYPKHYVIEPPFDGRNPLPPIRESDIVEFRGPREMLSGGLVQGIIERLPTKDVRTVPVAAPDKAGPPQFALTLADALEKYVEQESEAAQDHGADLALVSKEDLLRAGRDLLAQVPDARLIAPAGARVRVLGAFVMDFMRVRGAVNLGLENRGTTLLRGRMGAGKTSLVDAITWCIYGVTTPRKAGAAGASLRADDVINDEAEQCCVSVALEIDGKAAKISRTKRRGKTAVIEIDYDGVPPAGISDQQAIVQHLVGLPYDLWRSCVYLGQGAVANFITDADKRRKEMLSTAFSLGACVDAQKLVRSQLKTVVFQCERLRLEISSNTRALSEVQAFDYAKQIADFEARREAAKQAARDEGDAAKQAIAQCEESLGAEAQWVEARAQYDEQLAKLMKSYGEAFAGPSAASRERLGGLRTELGINQRDRARVETQIAHLKSERASGLGACPACKRPLDASGLETQIIEAEVKLRQYDVSIQEIEARLSQLLTEQVEAEEGVAARRAAIEEDIAKVRKHIDSCASAQVTFARLRDNRAAAEHRLKSARALWQHHESELNPWKAKQAEQEARVSALRAAIERDDAELRSLMLTRATLEFWETGFGQNGIPVLVLRLALFDLEEHANRFIAALTEGSITSQLSIEGDDLMVRFFKHENGQTRERTYLQLSGGEKRCVEMAFSPFALSEMIFSRCGVRVGLLVIDELTTHLGAEEKPIVCRLLRSLDRETVLVIDHDESVRGAFDRSILCSRDSGVLVLTEGGVEG